ncbi:MAG: penicillin acylase family protein [Gammaproteobacteria bacterium]|nr:penicillin acylase family protein [Gammaproteobacteria bacterium]
MMSYKPSLKTKSLPLYATLVLGLLGCGSSNTQSTYSAQIERTTHGIAHVTASTIKNAAYGVGYAFAQDNFCTLAEKILQVNGEYAKYFGANALVIVGSSATPNITALSSDFFHRATYDKAQITTLWEQANAETRNMAEGYVAGVNRYLSNTGKANLPTACRNATWVRPITPSDIYLWWSSIATIAASQAFAQAIADGYQIPATPVANAKSQSAPVQLAKWKPDSTTKLALTQLAERQQNAASNGWAFGADTSANGKGALLTNPHWPWTGMNKFYQAHITVPGSYDAMGVTYAGAPFILIGFNKSFGWTHTVSTGPRFIIRRLSLVTGTPTSYTLDGVSKAMTSKSITVEVKDSPAQTRTYYSTEFGPLLQISPQLGWSATSAYALTDINMVNNRIGEQWMALGRSTTIEEAKQTLGSILGINLVNTIMIDSTGKAAYADYSTKPNLSDEKLSGNCAIAIPGLFPVMDGSRAACGADVDVSTRQPGLLPVDKLPFLSRSDYVANANNSFWLTNPTAPITNLPRINGNNGVFISDIGFRPRMNLITIADRLAGRDGLSGTKIDNATMQAMLIGSNAVPTAGNRGMVAELMMPTVKTLCQESSSVTMPDTTSQNISAVCSTLASWDQRYHPQSVGTHVFREFYVAASAMPSLWKTPFSSADPVNTPRDPNVENAAVKLGLQQALGTAARRLASFNITPQTPWGQLYYADVKGVKIGVGGGGNAEGTPNQIHGAINNLALGGYPAITGGSSYVSTMQFGANGPEVDAVLIPGQSTDPASAYYYDQLQQLWTQRKWLRLPFTPAEIRADVNYKTMTVAE